MLRLSHARNSRSSRVRWLLEEIGAEYELVPVTRESRAGAEHLARHPLGRVPALGLYIAERHPEAGLLPAEASFERALVYQWISVGLTEIEPFIAEAARAAESDPDHAESARERARGAVRMLDAALGS